MNTKEIMDMSRMYIMNTYNRVPVVLDRGEGVYVWDTEGKRYLDFLAGIAVCSLGHCHPAVGEAIKGQVDRLCHVSNLYHIEPQVRLARLLVEHSCADKAFFCNSGAEANEGAIKLARKYGYDHFHAERYEIISMINSFHGRTLATVTATGQEKFHTGFSPLPIGFRYVPFNDRDALRRAVNETTCAVMIEPIQGEGGICVPDEGYLKDIRDLCDAEGLLLIFDEVQVGMGRTGTLFAYEQTGIEPDIITLAKALGNGFPVGALLAKDHVAASFAPGNHASTFGGNPVAMAAAEAVVTTLLNGDILSNVREMGTYFRERLRELKDRHAAVADVRGRGLIVGMELTGDDGPGVVSAMMEQGVLINCTAGNVLRFVPPLIVEKNHIDDFIFLLDEVLKTQ